MISPLQFAFEFICYNRDHLKVCIVTKSPYFSSGSGEDTVIGDQIIMDNNFEALTVQIPSPTKKSPKISPKYPQSPTKTANKKKSRATSTAGNQKSGRVYHAGMRTVYTSGRPPWYNSHGEFKDAFVIGTYQLWFVSI